MNEKIRIALIDDDPNVLKALELLLKACGYEPKAFPSSLGAVEILCRSDDPEYDLIFCDLRMPYCDGHEVLRRLRSARSQIPFFLISGHADEDEVQLAYQLGAQGFLRKPFTIEDLRAAVNTLQHEQHVEIS